jgi:Uma2 family endonuclease
VVGIQDPIRLADSEPEPDVTLLRARYDDYAASHPGSDDILLVVEVADSSLAIDRYDKGSLYSENGVVEYWILNIVDRTLEVPRRPQPTGIYAEVRVLSSLESTDIAMLPGESFSVADLFPPAKPA